MSDNLIRETKDLIEKSKSCILDKYKFFMAIYLLWH